jgi:AAA15 family ATPase/GTPase
MNEQLIVKNFGPIKDATVDFKRVTVFIGPTGGGKSTLAKLAAIMRERILFSADSKKQYGILNEFLYNYEINNYARKGSEFHWHVEDEGKSDKLDASEDAVTVHLNLFPQVGSKEDYVTSKLKGIIENNKNNKSSSELEATEIYFFTQQFSNEFDKLTLNWYSRRFPKSLYIPADRIFVSAALKGLSTIGLQNTSLGKPILDFLEAFAASKQSIIKFPIKFLDVVFESDGGDNRIKSSGANIYLHESASGIQSVAPMLSVILDKLRWNSLSFIPDTFNFIIEEPELNLYPTAQQGLLNWLVEKCTQGENDLTITTHSPYILSSCNLLLEAYKVAQLRPDLEDEIAAIVPKACWLNPDDFAAYYVADGTVKPITDERTHLIGGNELDAVSGDISDSFRKLLRLKKQAA